MVDVFKEIKKYRFSLIKKECDISKSLLNEYHRIHRLKQKREFINKVGSFFLQDKKTTVTSSHSQNVDRTSGPVQKMHMDYLENPSSES